MIFNLGSINADYFYQLPRLPGVGETLAAKQMSTGLGGKGANQSVAASLASAEVCHIGCVGPDGHWALERLRTYGVNVRDIRLTKTPTAHAIVMVDDAGENQIVIFPGANMDQDLQAISDALDRGEPDDWLILQNETSHQIEAAKLARQRGMKVAYSAAPFDVGAVQSMLPFATLIIMNAVEAKQFERATRSSVCSLSVPHVLITKGADGAIWYDLEDQTKVDVAAFQVTPIDTTGAGDVFAGYTIAGLSQGLDVSEALRQASAAAAISTTKRGTADSIPDLNSIKKFLAP